jgi:TonB-linked SusC/RagA family outer membrane protein
MKKILLSICILFMGIGINYAQKIVSGKVTDPTGDPVIGATVLVKESPGVGTITDIDGTYTVNVPAAGKTLAISFTGYKSQDVLIGDATIVNVVITEGLLLDEVVVTALGITKQSRETGYSVSTIKNSDLTAAKVTNLQNGLVGKVSGLQVSTVNNGINADTRIVLRGIRSLLGNNQALLVVDGTPVALNFINSINPNDVQSVNVLKGANAAALYGPEGVNGVIVVNTKKGGVGGKPQISVSNTTLVENISFLPDFQTRFGSGSSFNSFGDGIYDPIENQSWGDEFDGSTRPVGQITAEGETQELLYSYIPGEKARFFDQGTSVQNDVSYASGDEKANFYLSFQNVAIKAIMPGDKSNRTTLRMNASKVFGNFKAGGNINYTLKKTDNTTNGGGVYFDVQNAPGQIPITQYEDFQNDYWSNRNNYYNDYFDNPYETIYNNRNNSRNDDVVGNIELTFKPVKGIQLLNRLGFTGSFSNNKSFTRAVDYSTFAIGHRSFASGGSTKAAVGDGFGFGNRINNEFLISTDHNIGDISIKGLLGNLYRQTESKSIGISGGNLVIPTLFNVSNRTGEPGVGESNVKTRLLSAFGSISFGYKNWAFVEVTGRNDWDSRLPAANQSYFYPGISGSLILTDMIESLKGGILNYAKLKAAYAQTGNVNIGAYSTESTFAQSGNFPFGSLPGFTASNTINNPNIRPEIVKSTEVGVELSFLDSRVSLEAAYYFQDNNDQVIPIGISSATGYTSAFLNAASFENKGWEADLKVDVLESSSKFNWNIGGNVTYNTSLVNQIYEGLDELGIGNTAFVIKGYPAYTHKLKDWLRDPEGRVIIDPINGYPKQNPVNTIFGRTNPSYIFGVTNEFSYQGFSLRAVGEYRGGHFIQNDIGRDLGFTGISAQSAINGRQRFVFPNSVIQNADGTFTPNTNIVVQNAHYSFLQDGSFRNVQTNYYSSAAFFKIREIVLSYSLPSSLIKASKVLTAGSVSLVGRNLLMLRPSTNQWTDPEFANTTGNAVGFTNVSQSPPTRIFGFNVNLTF